MKVTRVKVDVEVTMTFDPGECIGLKSGSDERRVQYAEVTVARVPGGHLYAHGRGVYLNDSGEPTRARASSLRLPVRSLPQDVQDALTAALDAAEARHYAAEVTP